MKCQRSMHIIEKLFGLMVIGFVVIGNPGGLLVQADEGRTSGMVLEDFQHPDVDGFPQGWEGSRSKVTAQEAYSIHKEGDAVFLKGKGANQRVYTKNIMWDPKTHPILRWRWRVISAPNDADYFAAVFANLDVDFMFIPVSTKYIWSGTRPKGDVKDGGMFGAAEVVVRSGNEQFGEWIEEEVNAYKDFIDIHKHEPAEKAWGISLQSGPGVEVDFGSIEISEK
ncbi:DUF3047 domain-containing protein [Candidatus Nitronereus thalassa]|uniref:DUF3047 domain-containing protein n=1 Tax=Candidatus Nitronereus thalassa TaxID=3020898 RepID=A0ABU3KCN0_9BACT|nr:DUF3047 domain-containing protein [Candidatus Nitronereus thalassa]MDT7044175.1 DUF3047 domain-containing protein [Candidatus Nitronereus thalassa]